MTPATPDILAQIVARKHEELARATVSAAELRKLAESARAGKRDFKKTLRTGTPAIIAEIKKASPSRGVLLEDFHPADLAAKYQAGGAAALSVLTDRDFFQGSLVHLGAARAATELPVIRKDFTVAEYHVLEAAAHGADAILLIAAVLEEARLRAFRELAAELGMAALVEVHDVRELDVALRSGTEILGVNNRDLRTFQVSLETSLALGASMPANVTKVSESGIFCATDVRRLMAAGFHAFLVGEHLVKSGDPSAAIRELLS